MWIIRIIWDLLMTGREFIRFRGPAPRWEMEFYKDMWKDQ